MLLTRIGCGIVIYGWGQKMNNTTNIKVKIDPVAKLKSCFKLSKPSKDLKKILATTASATCVVLSSLTLTPSSASAVGIIDNFNSCISVTVDTLPAGEPGSNACKFGWGSPPGVYDNTAAADTGDVIGDVIRTIRFETFNGNGNGPGPRGTYDIDFFGSSDLLSINNNFGRSTLEITYSGLSANLVTLGSGSNDRFNFNVLSNDSTPSFPINFSVTVVQGSNTSTGSFSLQTSGAQNVLIPFSSFSGFFAANQSVPVNQLTVTFETSEQRDIAIDSIGVDPVPFEYSQELGLIAIAGLFGAYKLKAKKNKQ